MCGGEKPSLLHVILILSLFMTGYGQDGEFRGPLKPMTFTISEGEEKVNQVIFQFQTNTPNGKFQLSGETDNIFHITSDGILYYTGILDRENRAIHRLQVEVLDARGNLVEGPVPITIEVKDINDNRPVFLQMLYNGTVRQNSRPGKPFMYVNATDRDDPTTLHAKLFYRIAIQLPKIKDVMYFQIDNQTGGISLTLEGSKELDPFKNAHYDLVVSVMDMGGQSDNSFIDSTTVKITVEENIWKAPGLVTIKENSTEPHPLKITQPLDFETEPLYNLVIKAENPEPLVPEVQYNESSYAYFILMVSDVNEPPVFSHALYQAQVLENADINTKLIMVNATDPEGAPVSYSLSGDTRGWLRIDEVTGEIFTMKHLDREAANVYQVKVIATEKGRSLLTSSVYFHLTLLDVNDNPPRLVKDYTGFFFCYPLTAKGSVIFEATDDDRPPYRGFDFTFSLGSENLKFDWELSKINGTHAQLSTRHTNFEEKVYQVSVKINDGGNPPLENIVSFPVTMCTCTGGRCYQPADTMPGMPTVGIAIGILLTTFVIIGVILTVTFMHLKKKDNENKTMSPESDPLRT
ncbi:cadherin-17 [Gracilinanus agilis]|uniref:cadherin-17 n=1 Tax=Gracilinanus agilis TaxID=191870 RepID=UPI001CFF0800|nr:cadherin-17 [Gracilinanus agilis]